jgi:hypothetical protein
MTVSSWSRVSFVFILVAATFSATSVWAQGVSGQPQGLVCGLGYYNNETNIAMGACEGYQTASAEPYWDNCSSQFAIVICNGDRISCASGFLPETDGDTGLCSPWGFYHQAAWPGTAGLNASNSAELLLPKGTACGFKEECHDSSVHTTCMGYDAHVSCPPGWLPKAANDINAPGGCGFVWCEYQDPSNLCTGACQLTNQPTGIVCGIDDNDKHNGQCLGVQTDSGCPAGWEHHGFYDDGRGSGHGVGWCSKPDPAAP